jgi:hypothetical protein
VLVGGGTDGADPGGVAGIRFGDPVGG